MEEKTFRVGYTSYLSKPQYKKTKWTSNILRKITRHKIIAFIIAMASICMLINCLLIYKFMSILEIYKF